MGWVVYLAPGRHRRLLQANLQRYTAATEHYRTVLKQSIGEHGKTIFELPLAWFRPADRLVQLVRETEGMHHIEQARAQQHGIIFLTPHLGSFEIAGRYVASLAPVTFMYRPPKQAWLEPIMNAGRARANASMAPASVRGVRMMLRALKQGQAVGILPDHVPGGGEGVWVDFFGRPAYTMTLAARLQDASGAALIPFFAQRLPRGEGYKVIFAAPLDLHGLGAQDAALAMNRAVEALIARCPAQYMWGYNRYKHPAGAPLPPNDAVTHR